MSRWGDEIFVSAGAHVEEIVKFNSRREAEASFAISAVKTIRHTYKNDCTKPEPPQSPAGQGG